MTLHELNLVYSPSNVAGRRRAYADLENVDVRPLYLAESELTAPRMLALMGWSTDDIEVQSIFLKSGSSLTVFQKMPLYMHTVMHLIRDTGCDNFSYSG